VATLASLEVGVPANRWTTPRRRTENGWVDVAWDDALDAIADALQAVRKLHGPEGLGLWAGPAVGADTDALVRTAALALSWGTPHFYGPLANHGGAAWARACELVVGYPCSLLGDIGRAHYVLLLGGNQEAQGWGPLQGGRYHAQDLAFSRRTKGTKLVVVDPRRTATAASADLHLRPRPGTELFVVLGMIAAILEGGWYDKQYVRDYCGASGGVAVE
jgi:assimilatory nitrate reductase catalytic subunit